LPLVMVIMAATSVRGRKSRLCDQKYAKPLSFPDIIYLLLYTRLKPVTFSKIQKFNSRHEKHERSERRVKRMAINLIYSVIFLTNSDCELFSFWIIIVCYFWAQFFSFPIEVSHLIILFDIFLVSQD